MIAQPQILGVGSPTRAIAERVRVRPTRRAQLLRLVCSQPLGALAALVVIALSVAAVFANVLATHDPTAQYIRHTLHPPGTITPDGQLFLLGTDGIGRDVYSRLIHGARVSLAVGVAAVSIGTLGGLVLGIVSGYQGGRTDMILQRVMDSIQAIPVLVLALMLVAALGTSLPVTASVIGFTQIPRANRVIRSQTLSIAQEAYVEAARSLGASTNRILLSHVFPNVIATTLVVFSTSIGAAIVVEATLSFLGLAAPPPLATWGAMLSAEGQQYMFRAPWLLVIPATALSVTVLAFNFLGDAIRDALDPRLRQQ